MSKIKGLGKKGLLVATLLLGANAAVGFVLVHEAEAQVVKRCQGVGSGADCFHFGTGKLCSFADDCQQI